ncbi:Transcriptional activator of fatty acid utilization [Maublancomyces gigas]|uniref:Transcriptional activator of fatty acid utilization n=1 Tax=Discina gigas TaxID=1032678 RepID=A0ABR3GR89_9PEZI
MNFNTTPQTTVLPGQDGTPVANFPEAKTAQVAADNNTMTEFMKPKFARAPIKEAGRVAYLGESSNLSLLVHDKHGTSDIVHYPLPENIRGSRARLTELDTIEIDILHQRGAFLLPPRALCDELVEAYFKWIAPIVPVINRSRFMRRYRDPKNPPSLLLLQSVLLAGSRVCQNPQLMDVTGSTTPAAMTFYKRAKALYDANYEDDRVTIVQSLVLMGWYWEGPEDVTKNVFYWSRVATIVAQGSGMHRSVEHSQLSKADKRLWKRIWWTLFTRDRMVAVALGRPVHINTDDSDVEMMSEDDFLEDDEPGLPAEYPPNQLHVQFFLHHVKLCEIMGLVLSQQYSVASKARRQHQIDLVHSDLALADWMLHVPPEMRYHIEDKSRQNFWAALLHSTYYTTLCLLHRAHMPPSSSNTNGTHYYTAVDETYPSRNIAFKAATAITSIIDNLIGHDQLRYCPAFVVYSLFSALIMHVYQTRSTVPTVVAESKERMRKCMLALKEVSRIWIVAKMVYTLFESILGNKHLEERLQKSAGRRHHNKKPHHHQRGAPPTPSTTTTTASSTSIAAAAVAAPGAEPIKRKFDEMDLGALLPVPTMSYERSRALTPGASSGLMQGIVPSPVLMPTSRAITPAREVAGSPYLTTDGRSTTPFNPGLAMVPGTPPDLYLVTRSSPPISQSLWENFQPNQLFPDDSGISYLSPSQQNPALDPQLTQQGQGLSQHGLSQHLQQQFVGGGVSQWSNAFDEMAQGSSPEDTWSNSSKGGIVPTTLNVEDWYVFCSGETAGLPPPPLPPPPPQARDC